jgi:hypothetical protein
VFSIPNTIPIFFITSTPNQQFQSYQPSAVSLRYHPQLRAAED